MNERYLGISFDIVQTDNLAHAPDHGGRREETTVRLLVLQVHAAEETALHHTKHNSDNMHCLIG